MKKPLLILLCLFSFNTLIYASFPIIVDSNDPVVAPYIGGGLFLTGLGFAIYYLHRLYIKTYNPWLRFLGVFGIIVISIFALLFICIFLILASENFDLGMGG